MKMHSCPPLLHLESTHPFGFTLVEVLISVVLMAILATVLVPTEAGSQQQQLVTNCRMLASDLRLARSHAIEFNTPYTVQFRLAENQYEIVHSGSGSAPIPTNPLAGPGADTSRYVVTLGSNALSADSSAGPRLATVAWKPSKQNTTSITFQPTGGLGPDRAEDAILLLTAGQGTITYCQRLVVSWVTGQVWIDPVEVWTSKTATTIFE